MASDVNEHIFSEKQLFSGDVLGEDGEDVRRVFSEGCSRDAAAAKGAPSRPGGRVSVSKPSGAGPARERRRKRAAERAVKIVCFLDTKYDILHEVCASFENWKEAPSANVDFDLLWCDQAIQADRLMKLKPYQKMNHFVGMSSITRKNNLGRNLLRMRKQFPKEYRFFPDTWILPTDLSDFKQQFQTGKGKTFIIKPDNGCQGKGIFLIKDVEKVPVDFSTTHVAQRYVQKPFLLDGFKFDLRLYVLVVGCDPLRIFLHRHGLVRLASEQYLEPSGKNISQTMVHLTNYAINKMNPNFEECHKRSWEAVQQQLRAEGHDVDTLIQEIEDLIVKTLIAVQPSLSHFYHSCQPDDVENAMCFEVLGFDVLLDHKLQPWLLEVNHAPSFNTDMESDRIVKYEVLRDTFTLLNLCPEARRQKKRELREKMEQRAMGTAKKRDLEEQMHLAKGIAVERTAWEDAHLNGYKRLYPSEEKEREYMAIHDAAINIWEMLMGGTSRRSVRLTTQPATEEDSNSETCPDAKSERPRRKKATATLDAAEAKSRETRSAEELREVMERLMAGVSARPQASEARKRSSQESSALERPACSDPEEAAPTETSVVEAPLEAKKSQLLPRQEVRVGDVVKVQTNLGWETVIVRVKRANGRVDIQFKDGEYMRSVLPRILRETPATGGAGAGAGAGAGGGAGSGPGSGAGTKDTAVGPGAGAGAASAPVASAGTGSAAGSSSSTGAGTGTSSSSSSSSGSNGGPSSSGGAAQAQVQAQSKAASLSSSTSTPPTTSSTLNTLTTLTTPSSSATGTGPGPGTGGMGMAAATPHPLPLPLPLAPPQANIASLLTPAATSPQAGRPAPTPKPPSELPPPVPLSLAAATAPALHPVPGAAGPRAGAVSPSGRAPSVSRSRGSSGGPPNAMPLTNGSAATAIASRNMLRGGPLVSASPVRTSSTQDSDLQQLKHLFRVRTVNM